MPNTLFDEDDIAELLTSLDAQESTYYKAILQNLFFATLNQEMNHPPDKGGRGVRKFRGEGRQHYNITSLYRYKRYFKDPEAALRLFETIPFLNGGLFECLDKPDPDDAKTILRIDGFSDRDRTTRFLCQTRSSSPNRKPSISTPSMARKTAGIPCAG